MVAFAEREKKTAACYSAILPPIGKMVFLFVCMGSLEEDIYTYTCSSDANYQPASCHPQKGCLINFFISIVIVARDQELPSKHELLIFLYFW
jgi:hypothetical protein